MNQTNEFFSEMINRTKYNTWNNSNKLYIHTYTQQIYKLSKWQQIRQASMELIMS
jgi:hypothetical protein